MLSKKEGLAQHLVPKERSRNHRNFYLYERSAPLVRNAPCARPKQLVRQQAAGQKAMVCAHFVGPGAHSLQFSGFLFKFSERLWPFLISVGLIAAILQSF